MKNLLSRFEPQSIVDWLLIPWWGLRYLFAKIIWILYVIVCRMTDGRLLWMSGRYTSPEPIWCDRCFWAGMRRWAVHTYHPCGDDDVEPVDECPRCGANI
jgi:hypothetical protein